MKNNRAQTYKKLEFDKYCKKPLKFHDLPDYITKPTYENRVK